MDGERFDAIARVLAAPGSRRRALAALLGGALALLGGGGVAAHDALARCERLADPRRRRACRARARKHNRGHGTQPPPVCAGKNVCTDAAATCGGSCACYVQTGGGNLCAKDVGFTDDCGGCAPELEEVCVLGGGSRCDGRFRCVVPC